MTRTILNNTRKFALLATAAASFALVGCGQHEEGVGEHIDSAVSQVEQRATQAVTGVQASAQKLDQKMAAAAAEHQQDAAITAGIKAEFAADTVLNALRIDVQTKEGLVVLNGRAPDAASRDHATRVAATVKDVLSVDNKMVLPKT